MVMIHALRPPPGIPEDGVLDQPPAGSGLRCRVRVYLALGLGSLLLVPAAGCLFSTRTPEPPSVNNVPWADPDTPARVLTNVQVTFAAKSVANYDRSLASDFTFVLADGDRPEVAQDPTYFDGWNKQREVAAFTSIFQNAKETVSFAWGPPIPSFEDMVLDPADTGGKYYENLKYQMVFRRSGADTTFSGLVDLYLREQPGGWSIYRWVDRQDGLGHATLGLVRWKRKVWATKDD
jgi:hypothetical protein